MLKYIIMINNKTSLQEINQRQVLNCEQSQVDQRILQLIDMEDFEMITDLFLIWGHLMEISVASMIYSGMNAGSS